MYKVSVQAPYGVAVTTKVWNETMATYLTEQVGSKIGCRFQLAILASPDAAYSAIANNQTDFLLVSSGLMHCIQAGA